jgi:hypothetical protein
MGTSTPSVEQGNGLAGEPHLDAPIDTAPSESSGAPAPAKESAAAIRARESQVALLVALKNAPRHPRSVGPCRVAQKEAAALSKVGTKDRDARRFLTKLLVWLSGALAEAQISSDIILAKWAARDEDGEIKVVQLEGPDGQGGQRVIMRNEAEANFEQNGLALEEARNPNAELPEPLKLSKLEEAFQVPERNAAGKPIDGKWTTAITPDVAAALAPFITID